ncbi:DUF3597 domain-containing protein [Roseomonas sp. SSH11]|uniref:DUF3597 domain-containing protein n=1 Tax=Pararoseomonas baculiformis TaxID=2820812 RepID=A0ABS4A9H2_9PROT|nr:DUF3597 domain-containing protein [Pararoseomonas baculiformis]MBP0443643.1 DUF3597 domain-containing protein [Pararoseomonas baculiformis]
MSVFRSIMSKIFGHPAAASPADAGSPTPATTTGTSTGNPSGGIGDLGGLGTAMAAPATTPSTPALGQAPEGAPAPAQGSAAGGAPAQPVDVEAVLSQMAAQNPQKLNWQTSIVDLMKLLDLDSSLAARKELAGELGYAGSTDDSATMNIWLHKQVMRKLAENGGRVPESLRS